MGDYRSLWNPSTWLHVLSRMWINRHFFIELLRFNRAKSRTARRDSIEGLVDRLYNKAFLGDVAESAGSVCGIAKSSLMTILGSSTSSSKQVTSGA
jgi:hypothetical protein